MSLMDEMYRPSEVLHCIIGQKTRFIVHISHLLNLCADKRDYSLFITSKLYANSMEVELFIIHYSKLYALLGKSIPY